MIYYVYYVALYLFKMLQITMYSSPVRSDAIVLFGLIRFPLNTQNYCINYSVIEKQGRQIMTSQLSESTRTFVSIPCLKCVLSHSAHTFLPWRPCFSNMAAMLLQHGGHASPTWRPCFSNMAAVFSTIEEEEINEDKTYILYLYTWKPNSEKH